MSEYDEYVRLEWDLYQRDPARAKASLDAVEGFEVARVLDVGCGAGQELRPFVIEKGAFGVGLDVAPEVGHAAYELFAEHAQGARVVFVRGYAEALPFCSDEFDVVVCRIALPYTDNGLALKEMARVLRPGGKLLIKIHHARYYMEKMGRGLVARDWLSTIHASRVLVAGTIYHIAGKQPRNRVTGSEIFQTVRRVRRELEPFGLRIGRAMPDSNPATPSLLFTKQS